MKFELLPILDRMIDLYGKPASMERFNAYLKILEGNSKGNMEVPIGGFNPMAKGHVLEMLLELKKTGIEGIISDTLKDINGKVKKDKPLIFKTAFNLSDDLKGAWTNRFTSDYQSKFQLNALIKRNFCVTVFWSSEKLDAQTIRLRTREACYRTLYRLDHAAPKSLIKHVEQELFVNRHTETEYPLTEQFKTISHIFNQQRDTEEFTTILNFLYGDQAAIALGNQPIGVTEAFGGFRFIKTLSAKD